VISYFFSIDLSSLLNLKISLISSTSQYKQVQACDEIAIILPNFFLLLKRSFRISVITISHNITIMIDQLYYIMFCVVISLSIDSSLKYGCAKQYLHLFFNCIFYSYTHILCSLLYLYFIYDFIFSLFYLQIFLV